MSDAPVSLREELDAAYRDGFKAGQEKLTTAEVKRIRREEQKKAEAALQQDKEAIIETLQPLIDALGAWIELDRW